MNKPLNYLELIFCVILKKNQKIFSESLHF